MVSSPQAWQIAPCHFGSGGRESRNMRRINQERPLTPPEAAKYDQVRARVAKEFAELLARHHEREAAAEAQGQAVNFPDAQDKSRSCEERGEDSPRQGG